MILHDQQEISRKPNHHLKRCSPQQKWQISRFNIIIYIGKMQGESKFCEFCQILYKQDINKKVIIAANDQFFAFHDIDDAGAQAHVLVCTKQHIQSALHLTNPQTAFEMRRFGQQVLTKLFQQSYKKAPKSTSFRFGFHLPPYISVDHIHLHCFILPFKNMMMDDKVKYGFGSLLKSVEEVVQKVIGGKPKI